MNNDTKYTYILMVTLMKASIRARTEIAKLACDKNLDLQTRIELSKFLNDCINLWEAEYERLKNINK